MTTSISLADRARQVAATGAYRSMARVKTALKREGYIGVETALREPALNAEVTALLKALRPPIESRNGYTSQR